jgi:hypothetical protein
MLEPIFLVEPASSASPELERPYEGGLGDFGQPKENRFQSPWIEVLETF